MTEIIHKPRAIEPADVWMPSSGTFAVPLRVRTWHPDSSMRRLGFTRNPMNCIHERKEYYDRKWRCQLCGEAL